MIKLHSLFDLVKWGYISFRSRRRTSFSPPTPLERIMPSTLLSNTRVSGLSTFCPHSSTILPTRTAVRSRTSSRPGARPQSPRARFYSRVSSPRWQDLGRAWFIQAAERLKAILGVKSSTFFGFDQKGWMAESKLREGVVDLVMTLALEQLRTGQACEGPRDATVLEDLSDFSYL